METAIGETVVQALAGRDPERLRSALHDSARLRALIPSGLVEASGSQEFVATVATWFADMDTVRLVAWSSGTVADRLQLSYRLELGQGDVRWLCAQEAFCKIVEGRVFRMDLVCSGFREIDPTGSGQS